MSEARQEEAGQRRHRRKFRESFILVVDDDPFLQKLAIKFLRALQYEAAAVGSAYETLQQLKKQPLVSLILMDCFMPGMDGFALTGKIRSMEHFGHLPIIGMSASVGVNETRCFAAGMSDFLNKPFTLQELGCKVAKWLPVKSSGAQVEPSVLAGSSWSSLPSSSAVVDLSRLEQAFGREACIEILQTFVSSNSSVLDEMKLAARDKRQEKVRFLSHRLSGAASLACMKEMSRTSTVLEEAARRADWMEVDKLLKQLSLELRKAHLVSGQLSS